MHSPLAGHGVAGEGRGEGGRPRRRSASPSPSLLRRAGGGGFDEPSLWMGNTRMAKEELQLNPLLLPSSINQGVGGQLAAHALTPLQVTDSQELRRHSLVGPHDLKKSLSAKGIRGAGNS